MAEVSLLLKKLETAEDYAQQSFDVSLKVNNVRMQIRSRVKPQRQRNAAR